MVVSVCDHASLVGADVLRRGGSAVDAAIAVAFALAVTYPPAGNIGGGGFMLIHPADGSPPVCVDYRECAPAAATTHMLAHDVAETDARMVGVPGTVRGLALAHEHFGRTAWRDLVGPAVELAERGFPVNAALARSLNDVRRHHPQMSALQAAYRPPRGSADWSAGDRLIQPELAETLRRLADGGETAFYEGAIADQIVAEMSATNGLITRADLAAYRARLRPPIRGAYRGFDIFAAPPPSSGGIVLVEALHMLEPFELRQAPRWSVHTLHIISECMRRAYRDRAAWLGDPDFVPIPGHLVTRSYARALADSIDPARATPSASLAGEIALANEGESTTHFSVVDASGMAVANTYTLEDSYGSKIVVRGAGFLLNNQMGDFNARPGLTDRRGAIGTPPNVIVPGKRMLSSQTPAIVARNGRPVIVTGSPGGRTIPNTVLCVLLNALEFEMPPADAVAAARLHHQWFPDEIRLETTAPVTSDAIRRLQQMGHAVRQRTADGSPFVQGDAHTIFVRNSELLGIADHRIHGSAIGVTLAPDGQAGPHRADSGAAYYDDAAARHARARASMASNRPAAMSAGSNSAFTNPSAHAPARR